MDDIIWMKFLCNRELAERLCETGEFPKEPYKVNKECEDESGAINLAVYLLGAEMRKSLGTDRRNPGTRRNEE